MKELLTNIAEWAKARGLVAEANQPSESNPMRQFGKLLEEVQELHDAVIDSMDCDGECTFMPTADVVDGIGDCTVVLAILAAQYGLTLDYCLESAYEQIKNRKGRTMNGVFVKEN